MLELKNKKIGILGIGIEGVATAHFLRDSGATLTMLDQKEEAQIDRTLLSGLKQMGITNYILGSDYLTHLEEFDIIIRSPGIKYLLPELQHAKNQGVTITSHMQLFFDHCPSKIIGVTGTKGKGTTSTLILEMLKKAGKDAYLGGNIGLPPLTFLAKLTAESIVVLELSSFKLQDLHTSPHIAVMLMVTSEHLDYHKDTYEYIDAKRNILRFQRRDDIAILNRDYLATHESDIYTEGQIYQISRERTTDQGCYVEKDAIYLRQHGKEQKLIDTKEILLPGKHNLENVSAAVMAATLAGVKKETIIEVLKTFKGLEHRLELVETVNGVRYYDDSFSTTPETAIAAIQAFHDPEILILGGSHKGSDFTELGKVISTAKNIKAIIGVGIEWEEIKATFSKDADSIILIEGAKDMDTIVKAAAKIATEGNVVILSPACASFDMFKNYKERGNQFKEAVKHL
jgi:UDP-N-acetylmuramoylalanine--D-glutamate ligase